MQRKIALVTSLCILVTGLVAAAAAPAPPAPDRILVRMTPQQAAAAVDTAGLEVLRPLAVPADADGRRLFVARPPAAATSSLKSLGPLADLKSEPAQLASLPEVATSNGASAHFESYLENLLASRDLVPFGSDWRQLWEAYVLQPSAWAIHLPPLQPAHGAGVTVAIIDTGVDPDHELFRHRLVAGYDFVAGQAGFASEWVDLDQSSIAILGQSSIAILGQSSIAILGGLAQSSIAILGSDQIDALADTQFPPAFGHGTLAAGVVHRIAPDASIMPLRAFTGHGYGALEDIIEAIYFAVDNGADVINMSFTLTDHSAELQAAVDYATANGVLMVGAAGNDGITGSLYPAAMSSVIGVGSMDYRRYTSDFSNYGNGLVTIAGPGEYVISAFPGDGWAMCAGTSYAAPWVSGLLALLVERADVTHPEALAALAHAQDLRGDHHEDFGFGALDAAQAWLSVH